MLPFKSLDAASTDGPGAAVDCQGLVGNLTMIAGIEDASPIAAAQTSVIFEGSHDGEMWASLAGADVLDNPDGIAVSTSAHTVRYLRARVHDIADLQGGTATAWVVGR